ncbi:DUF3311 domain-containing protein [Modestobacter sp. I12A-02628]|uniref:DUF3311 domain-containing protein n=1 Tax=Goekera deserti TaxID=2497753 RepID=A0A7K3WB83_9ACTN|nr:DUF3311 domain-containing protein [Goekera deserti]NDI47839.1 DUF3311 domain-containing protein [Goekera deserti]NEL53587.1 DUF3311 domain-containing protein [Goekera deserti]
MPLAPRRSDRSPWNWLLAVPIVLPLLVPLYNREDPTLFGWPFFYWFQLSLVALGVLTTSLVYRAGRRGSAATHPSPAPGPHPRDEHDGGR